MAPTPTDSAADTEARCLRPNLTTAEPLISHH
jgi:hypothetical protein